MCRWDKPATTAAVGRGNRYQREFKNPSFSSTLLDEIYRSIDEGNNKLEKDWKFYGESMSKKQSKGAGVMNGMAEEEELSVVRRACSIEKWMDKRVSQKVIAKQKQRRQNSAEFERDYYDIHPEDVLFFGTGSSSSDSSSGGFSSSDTDSIYGTRSKVATSSFAPVRRKLVRTSIPAGPEKTERSMRTLLYEQRELHDYHYNSATEHSPRPEGKLIKSKSRALKIYSNLKKTKQPISPGAKFAKFINSFFSTGGIKKSKNSSSSTIENCREEKKHNAGQESICSSAPSFSRSCLSKDSQSRRELPNGLKRTVRFYPVSVIVDKDCKPCRHKSQKVDEQQSLMSVSLSTAWTIGKSPSRKLDDEFKHQLPEKCRRAEKMAKEFPKDYHQIQKQNELIMTEVCFNRNTHYKDGYDDDDDDDATSYSSSDLFELDHLAVDGNDRYHMELPVYETTYVDINRAIANGLII